MITLMKEWKGEIREILNEYNGTINEFIKYREIWWVKYESEIKIFISSISIIFFIYILKLLGVPIESILHLLLNFTWGNH